MPLGLAAEMTCSTTNANGCGFGQWLMVLAAYACKAKLRQTKKAA